jgi:hypothetical protein
VHNRDGRVVRVEQSHIATLPNCLRWWPLLGASEEGAECAARAQVKLHERARRVAVIEDRLEAQGVRVGRKLREQRALTLQGTRLPGSTARANSLSTTRLLVNRKGRTAWRNGPGLVCAGSVERSTITRRSASCLSVHIGEQCAQLGQLRYQLGRRAFCKSDKSRVRTLPCSPRF